MIRIIKKVKVQKEGSVLQSSLYLPESCQGQEKACFWLITTFESSTEYTSNFVQFQLRKELTSLEIMWWQLLSFVSKNPRSIHQIRAFFSSIEVLLKVSYSFDPIDVKKCFQPPFKKKFPLKFKWLKAFEESISNGLLQTLAAVGKEQVPGYCPYPDPLEHPYGISQPEVALKRTIMYKILIPNGSSFEFCYIFGWHRMAGSSQLFPVDSWVWHTITLIASMHTGTELFSTSFHQTQDHPFSQPAEN